MDTMSLRVHKQLQYATVSLRGYRSLARVDRRSFRRFMFSFALLIWMIGIVLPFVIQQFSGNSYHSIIEKVVPEFSYQDGVMSCGSHYYIDPDYCIVVDSDLETVTEDMLKQYKNSSNYTAIFGSRNCVLQHNNRTINVTYHNVIDKDYSKDRLLQNVPILYLITGGVMIIGYFLGVGFYYLYGFLLGLFAYILNLVTKRNLYYYQCYRIGIYATVTLNLIDAIMRAFRLKMPVLSIASFDIRYINILLILFYLNVGVLMQKNKNAEEEITETIAEPIAEPVVEPDVEAAIATETESIAEMEKEEWS